MLPMGTRDLALRVKILPMGTREKKKKASTDGGQLFTKVALRSNVFHRPFFATGPPLRLRSRPPDSGFAGVLPRHCRHVIHAHLLGFWKLQNFLRPINASMKEAKARRRRRRRRRRSRSREARAELYMQSAHSRIDRPRRLTSTPLIQDPFRILNSGF